MEGREERQMPLVDDQEPKLNLSLLLRFPGFGSFAELLSGYLRRREMLFEPRLRLTMGRSPSNGPIVAWQGRLALTPLTRRFFFFFLLNLGNLKLAGQARPLRQKAGAGPFPPLSDILKSTVEGQNL